MIMLSTFSEKERQYYQYQARQEYLREQKAIQLESEQTRQRLEQASQQLEKTTSKLLQGKAKYPEYMHPPMNKQPL